MRHDGKQLAIESFGHGGSVIGSAPGRLCRDQVSVPGVGVGPQTPLLGEQDNYHSTVSVQPRAPFQSPLQGIAALPNLMSNSVTSSLASMQAAMLSLPGATAMMPSAPSLEGGSTPPGPESHGLIPPPMRVTEPLQTSVVQPAAQLGCREPVPSARNSLGARARAPTKMSSPTRTSLGTNMSLGSPMSLGTSVGSSPGQSVLFDTAMGPPVPVQLVQPGEPVEANINVNNGGKYTSNAYPIIPHHPIIPHNNITRLVRNMETVHDLK